MMTYFSLLVARPRAPPNSRVSLRLHWFQVNLNWMPSWKLSKNRTDALLGRQHVTACCAIPQKIHLPRSTFKGTGIEQRCVEQWKNSENASPLWMVPWMSPQRQCSTKNFSKVVLSFLIRPLCLHARSGPLTPGQGWSSRYFRGHTRSKLGLKWETLRAHHHHEITWGKKGVWWG